MLFIISVALVGTEVHQAVFVSNVARSGVLGAKSRLQQPLVMVLL
jgi:hypothetical protein